MNRQPLLDGLFAVCIVGSGPAGIITALEYSARNPDRPILLVEYGLPGDQAKNSLDDSIRIANPVNHHDPYECTNKGFGGTSATWGGRCVMYDEIDFAPRPVLEGGCTWDAALHDELKKYLPGTASYFECGDADFDLKKVAGYAYRPIAEGFVEGTVTDSVVERWSLPTRFGRRYRKEIASRPNLVLLEGYEARTFAVPDASGVVSSLVLRQVATGEPLVVKAESFVIAAGAQESTRLLLRNPHLFGTLGGPPAALGKYYQGHLSGKIASVRFYGDPRKTDYGFITDREGVFLRRRFQFEKKHLLENNLLNTAIWLDNPLYFDPAHGSGPMSFMYLAMITPVLGKKLAPPAIAQSITKGKVTGIPQHLRNIARGLPHSLTTPATIFYKRYLMKRKLPGVFLYSPTNEYALHFHSEQAPRPSNRMRLGEDGETLVIDYHLADEDVHSVIRLHKTLDDWLRQCGCGELRYWFGDGELFDAIKGMSRDGIHQSGTTRMGGSAESGVVDQDLKAWGTGNVYVCSSSVFPTSGQANPTFLLGAFAVRLAEHLTNRV